MNNRDTHYTLERMIEFNEGYFTVESSEIEQEKGVRGRGAAGKINIAIIVELTRLEDIETGTKANFLKLFDRLVITSITEL